MGGMMRRTLLNLCVLCALAAVLGGCSTYYRVNDPAGSKEYYTTDIDETKTGAISFKDAKSGSEVRLQSSEVKKISEEEFMAAVEGEKKTRK